MSCDDCDSRSPPLDDDCLVDACLEWGEAFCDGNGGTNIPAYTKGRVFYESLTRQYSVTVRGSVGDTQHEISPCNDSGDFSAGGGGFNDCENSSQPSFTTNSNGDYNSFLRADNCSNPCNFKVITIKAAGYGTILATRKNVDFSTISGCSFGRM